MEGVGDSKSACSFPFGIPTAVASPASPGGAEQFEARPSQERGGGAALSSKAHLLGSRLVARGDWNWLCLSPWQLLVLRPPRASPPGKGAGKGAGLTQQLWSPAPREREAGRGGGLLDSVCVWRGVAPLRLLRTSLLHDLSSFQASLVVLRWLSSCPLSHCTSFPCLPSLSLPYSLLLCPPTFSCSPPTTHPIFPNLFRSLAYPQILPPRYPFPQVSLPWESLEVPSSPLSPRCPHTHLHALFTASPLQAPPYLLFNLPSSLA